MIEGLFWMLAANAAALLGARSLLGKVKTGQTDVDLVLFLLLRIALLSATVLVTGVLGVLTARGIGLLAAAALIGLVARGAHRGLPRPRRPDVGIVMGAFALLIVLRLLLQVWFFAPYVGDTLSYHLPKVAEWVRAGAITREMGIDARSSFPAGFELVEVWWVVFLHHDLLIEMAGLEFLALAFAATCSLARRVGLDERSAFLAGLVYAMTPGLHLQATSCLNDAPVAALVVATVALVAARVHILLVVLPAGLGFGMKATYAYALAGVILLAFLLRREPRPAPSPRRWAAGVAAVSVLVGGAWYARNAALYGNPFYPVGAEGFVNWQGAVIQQAGPNLKSLRDNTRRLIDKRIYDPGPYGAMLDHAAGWGSVAFACGAPALLAALRAERRMRPLALAFAAGLGSVFLFVSSDPWVMRFALFSPALLALAVAWIAEAHPPVRWIAGAALALQFMGTAIPAELPVGALGTSFGQSWSTRRLVDLPPGAPSTDVIGCYGPGVSRSYLLYRPDYSRRVAYFREPTAEALVAAMRREGVRFLFASMSAPVIAEGVEKGLLRPEVGSFFALR